MPRLALIALALVQLLLFSLFLLLYTRLRQPCGHTHSPSQQQRSLQPPSVRLSLVHRSTHRHASLASVSPPSALSTTQDTRLTCHAHATAHKERPTDPKEIKYIQSLEEKMYACAPKIAKYQAIRKRNVRPSSLRCYGLLRCALSGEAEERGGLSGQAIRGWVLRRSFGSFSQDDLVHSTGARSRASRGGRRRATCFVAFLAEPRMQPRFPSAPVYSASSS